MFNSENKYCHSALLNITAEFKETPVLLVIDNEIEGLITTDVPKLFIIKNNTYSSPSPLSYFHQNNKFWRITKLFYQLQ